jgi:hypothetical protein
MTKRYPVNPAPGPLEDYAQSFDDLFGARAQRHAFRRYMEGLLLPAERNKTLTALANTEPVVGAQRREAQSLQWFLSESRWDPEELNERRLKLLLLEEPNIAANDEGVLWSSTSMGTASGVRKPLMWAGSGLQTSARQKTGWSALGACLQMRESTIGWTSSLTLPLTTSREATMTPIFVPS